jgi:hypothetical protein
VWEKLDNRGGFADNFAAEAVRYGLKPGRPRMRAAAMRHAVVFVLALLAVVDRAHAQRQVAPYQASQPALSPYMYLTMPDLGPFPNYQAFVEPLQNQRQTNFNQQSAINRLQRDVKQPQTIYEAGDVAATGTGATYHNHSHYYPSLGNSAGQRAAGGRGGQRVARNRTYTPSSPQNAGGYGAATGGGFY